MPLFDNDAEQKRKENLRILEDKRVRFAEKMEKQGFRPERMLMCADEEGGFTALARIDNKVALIAAPHFAQDDDFEFFMMDADQLECDREEIFIKGTGLNGAFGFGVKGAKGLKLHFKVSEDRTVTLEMVAGRSSALEILKYSKNPLLKTARRRGDSNIVWDFMPLDPSKENRAEAAVNEFYLA